MSPDFIFKLIGAVGLVLISLGILMKRGPQNRFFIAGGVCLEVYSLYLGDIIFIILQIVFIASAIWDLRSARSKE